MYVMRDVTIFENFINDEELQEARILVDKKSLNLHESYDEIVNRSWIFIETDRAHKKSLLDNRNNTLINSLDISAQNFISKIHNRINTYTNKKFDLVFSKFFLEHIKNEGYDGIIFHELTPDQTEIELDNGEVYKTVDIDTGITYIAFKPEQIKSALGNNGNFNPNSKNINENNSIIGWVKTD
mgnify:CR=1 FL=1